VIVGILQFELLIPDPESLKDKRRVVRSIKDRLHQEHQVAVAEVAQQDNLVRAVLGLACVGADSRRIGEVLDHITEKLRGSMQAHLGYHLGDVRRQILTGIDVPDAPEETVDSESLAREMLRGFDDPTRSA